MVLMEEHMKHSDVFGGILHILTEFSCFIKYTVQYILSFFRDSTAPSGPSLPNYRGFTTTLRRTTHDMIPLDE